jgi:exodeoxyribonuclease VII large subunit
VSGPAGQPDLFSAPPEPDRTGPRVWRVTEVNQVVRGLLEAQIPPVWVAGEVASWTRARSGHCYFTLKDDRAQLRCVMWRSDAERLPADPEDGMEIRAFGTLTVYEARGEYQLSVRRLEAEGSEGLWRLAFEKLRGTLAREGLLDPARKRRLPPFPGTIGVVTSLGGAALHDILTVVRRRAPWTRVLVRGTRVQGEGAAVEIARAVRILGESGLPEVVIVGRGGGSLEDLWAFNEEPVARAIVACPVPVISAVGHEVDVTISDLVADHRAPTPSAAAEAAVPDAATLSRLLDSVRPRLAKGLRRQIERRAGRLTDLRRRVVRSGGQLVGPRRRVVERGYERLRSRGEALVETRRNRLASAVGKLEALSPLATLRRGYSVAVGEEGTVLRTTEAFSVGVPFHLRVVDGRVRCEPVSVEKGWDT